MKTSSIATIAFAAAASAADMSICDKYTTALLKNNTAANQQALLTLVVNTAVIGNYTKPNVGIKVPGILAPGTGKYAGVNLLPYFDGSLLSTNNGGSSGVSVNFLDGGGAAPLMKSMPADNNNSAQYTLLTHLYEYFAVLLGCSMYGTTASPYAGSTSMYSVHKFMDLDNSEMGWFIQNVGMSAASFGVSTDDVTTVGNALEKAFGMRCSPPAAVPPTASAALQAICIASDCPIAPSATCAAYAAAMMPSAASTSMASMSSSMPSGSSSGSMPSSSSPAPYTGAGTVPVVSGFAATLLGLVAFLL